MLPLTDLLVFPAFLVLARVAGAIMVFPVLSDPNLNVRARLLVAVGLTLAMFPLLQPVLPALPSTFGALTLLVFGEVLMGVILGLSVRWLMAAFSLAGELIAFMAGFQAANLFDPQSGSNTTAPAVFLTLCAGVMLLALNLHHEFFRAVLASYTMFPPGELPGMGPLLDALTGTIAQVMALGLQLAAPVIVTGVLANALFGILNRLVPQIQMFFITVPITLTLSMLILASAMTGMLGLWSNTVQSNLTVFQVDDTNEGR